MDKDVIEILDYFSQSSATKRELFKSYISSNKLESISLICALLAFLFGVIFTSLGSYQLEATCAYIIFFGMLILYSLSSFLSTLKSIFDYKSEVLDVLKLQHNANSKQVIDLCGYSNSSLETVKGLFQSRMDFINKRIGFIVGAVDKLGIIPAILMMYFTYVKVSESTSGSNFQLIFVSFVSGVYLGAIIARVTIDFLEEKIAIIDGVITKNREGRISIP